MNNNFSKDPVKSTEYHTLGHSSRLVQGRKGPSRVAHRGSQTDGSPHRWPIQGESRLATAGESFLSENDDPTRIRLLRVLMLERVLPRFVSLEACFA